MKSENVFLVLIICKGEIRWHGKNAKGVEVIE